MPPQPDFPELKRLLEMNTKLLEENNRLVKRLYRWTVGEMLLRVVWYIILIGAPFLLYFYVLEPYMATVGDSYQQFMVGVGKIPGFEGLDQLIQNTFKKD